MTGVNSSQFKSLLGRGVSATRRAGRVLSGQEARAAEQAVVDLSRRIKRGYGRSVRTLKSGAKRRLYRDDVMREYANALKQRAAADSEKYIYRGVAGSVAAGAGGLAAGKALGSKKKQPHMPSAQPQYIPMEYYEALDEFIGEILQEWVPNNEIINKGVRSLSPLRNRARRTAAEVARDMDAYKRGVKGVKTSLDKRARKKKLFGLFST